MTFNLLMFGSDGWIMTADTCAIQTTGASDPTRVTTASMRKIFFDEPAKLACCFSGDGCSLRTALRLFDQAKTIEVAPDPRLVLKHLADLSYEAEKNGLGPAFYPHISRTTLLVVHKTPWTIPVSSDSLVKQWMLGGTLFAGDTANLSRFYGERCYPVRERRTVRTDLSLRP